MALFVKVLIFSLFLHECCGYSLEVPLWVHMFSWRNKKNMYLDTSLIWSYDNVCIPSPCRNLVLQSTANWWLTSLLISWYPIKHFQYKIKFYLIIILFVCLSSCLTCQLLWVILCHLLLKSSNGIEQLVDDRKMRNRGGLGKKQILRKSR